MTNAEIDALVAEKIMGWLWVMNSHNVHGWATSGRHGDNLISLDLWKDWVNPLTPPFSIDIAEAWSVVERLTRQEYEVRLIARPQGALQVVELHRYPVKIAEVYAHTMPTAICIAALRVVGVTVEA